jgi:hypothetical protein
LTRSVRAGSQQLKLTATKKKAPRRFRVNRRGEFRAGSEIQGGVDNALEIVTYGRSGFVAVVVGMGEINCLLGRFVQS